MRSKYLRELTSSKLSFSSTWHSGTLTTRVTGSCVGTFKSCLLFIIYVLWICKVTRHARPNALLLQHDSTRKKESLFLKKKKKKKNLCVASPCCVKRRRQHLEGEACPRHPSWLGPLLPDNPPDLLGLRKVQWEQPLPVFWDSEDQMKWWWRNCGKL